MTSPYQTKHGNSNELAYDIALKSYEILYDRIEAHNGKIQSMMASSSTVTFASIIAGKALELEMAQLWYSLILFVFFSTIVLSLRALLWLPKGSLIALDPGIVVKDYSKYEPDEFRKRIAKHSGNHFTHNSKVLDKKWRASGCIAGLILAEVCLVVLWISVFG